MAANLDLSSIWEPEDSGLQLKLHQDFLEGICLSSVWDLSEKVSQVRLELMLLAPRLHSENQCFMGQDLGCRVGGAKFLLLPFAFSFSVPQ